MRAGGRPPALLWLLIALFALSAWLVPLVVVWLNAQEARRAARRAPPPDRPAPGSDVPLILYADTWPTRAVVNIEEIQGRSSESDVALGTAVVAHDLSMALQQLGIASEQRRIDSITDAHDLLLHREIVLIYPCRHAQPPWQVTHLLDSQFEPLVASQDRRLGRVQVRDVAIAEDARPAQSAQASLASALSYYSISYRSGPELLESMNSIVIYQHLQELAEQVRTRMAEHE
jgi:hypothetical protein